ncbi:ferredoxin [Rhodococcus sp. USK13]|uniref:ferredoxin n=1 Tax=Rhodococcus sp. USK13 TaxID=2806442 RepID=UPI001BCC4239|nr:ferredoxin [Rhodococcus sp. USK13]
MKIRLHLDAAKCQGYANCLIEAPTLWDFDDESDRAVLLVSELDESQRERAEASVRCCPAQAISIEEIEP